ncbi:hypothetical protein GCM10027343_37300 [Noviherbaspirillum agri]
MAFVLVNAAQRLVINRKGETLADYLYVLSAQSDKAMNEHNAGVMKRVAAAESRMYILGRLTSFNRDKVQVFLPAVDRARMPKTLISTEMLDSAIGQSAFVRNLLDSGSGSIIGLAAIEPAGGEWWKAVSIAALTTSVNGIPANSSIELEFEAHLTANNRSFLRPLQIAVEGQPAAKPVYLLIDTPDRLRCEIWGVGEECVLSEMRRREKDAKDSGKALITWSANPRLPFPDVL